MSTESSTHGRVLDGGAAAGSVVEPATAATARRALGAYYTPSALADYAAGVVVDGVRSAPTILDPACGDGRLLAAAVARWFAADPVRYETDAAEDGGAATRRRLKFLSTNVFGVDRDPTACRAARARLLRLALRVSSDESLEASDIGNADLASLHIHCGDALLDPLPGGVGWPARFDLIVANPPFLNIRRLAEIYDSTARARLRTDFETARGNFDLYVLFIERAMHWLRNGGRAGFITPNKLATLDYAAACRQLLLQRASIESVLDATEGNWFGDAGVYPYVWVFRKRPAAADHRIAVRVVKQQEPPTGSAIQWEAQASVAQIDLRAAGFVLSDDLPLEQRRTTRPLFEWGQLHSGASGYTAQRLLTHLHEANESSSERLANSETATSEDRQRDLVPGEEAGWSFIVSGNVDRYRIDDGDVRYMKHRFAAPRLSRRCPLSERKRTLYDADKIVVAGMGRRLEAARDRLGRALGVQVYAVTEFGERGDYLLGLLNSKLLSWLFRRRFAAKRLAGGYLAVNKGQLAQLPIVECRGPEQLGLRERIVREVRNREQAESLGGSASGDSDQRLDKLVYQLYGLRADEIRRVEDDLAGVAGGL